MRLRDALAEPGLRAIAEIKRRSPSAGDLRPEADPAQLAAAFERAGAAAVSVLVDERFAGSPADLTAARSASRLPLLAKGFFSERRELEELRELGADGVLLLLRDLDDSQARELMGAAEELGLDALVEAHDAEELERAVELGAAVIGVNARDLNTFEIDRAAQLALVERAPRDRVVIAESAIASRAQGAEAELAGADAILVGSTLMRAADPAAKLSELISRPLVKVCGLTRDEDVAVAAEAGADLAGFILARETPRRAPGVLPACCSHAHRTGRPTPPEITPPAARNDYLSVINDRSTENAERFFDRHAARPLNDADKTTVLKLLELQRHAMLMYTSCGWFFDELSGIETVQVIQFAARAVQLAQELFGDSLEGQFVERLALAKSNLPEHGDGRRVYEKFVRPAMVDWERLGAHYAISSLFESYPEQTKIYCFMAECEDYQILEAGMAKMAVGRVKLISEITRESSALGFGVIHMGDHNVNGGVQKYLSDESYQALIHEAAEPLTRADFAEVIRLMDRRFGESHYSVRSLFRDEQRKTLDLILSATLGEAETLYRQIYEHRAPMMRFLTALHIPLPKAFQSAAEIVLNRYLRRAFEQEEIDTERINGLLETAKVEGISLDNATLEFAFRKNIERMAERFAAEPTEAHLRLLDTAAGLLRSLPFTVDLWKVQNVYYGMLKNVYPKMRENKERGDELAQALIDGFEALGQKLAVKVT